MKKIKRLLRQFHKKNQGFTLVEMIVSFLLIGLFMVAASKVIINTANVYYEAKGTANGMQICSILTAKVRGEVEGARASGLTESVLQEDGTTKNVKYAVVLSHDGEAPDSANGEKCNRAELIDSTGSHIYIGVNEESYLVIHYIGASGKSSNWVFDKNTYMGYTVTDLSFEIPSECYNNVVCMTLTVHSPRYGDFTVTEYIECYNLSKDGTDQIYVMTE